MEEVPGLPGGLPILALYPPSRIKASVNDQQWKISIESWIQGIEIRLRLRDEHFRQIKLSQPASGIVFLRSYFANSQPHSTTPPSKDSDRLRKDIYLLTKRLLLGTDLPYDLLPMEIYTFLCSASTHFSHIGDWKSTLGQSYKRSLKQLQTAIEAGKSSISTQFPSMSIAFQTNIESLSSKLNQSNALIKSLPEAGLMFMTGSDYLESQATAYTLVQPTSPSFALIQKSLTEHLFYCLRSLMSDGTQRISTLLDHLYFLKSEVQSITTSSSAVQASSNQKATLLSSLVCTTSFLRHLTRDTALSENKRAQAIIEFLTSYKTNCKHLHPLPPVQRTTKISKGKRREGGMSATQEEMHMHKAAQISQVHELFPDLPNGHIMKLLDHFGDDVETTIAGLLEPDSLPEQLRNIGPSDQSPAVDLDGPAHDLAPHSTPPLLPRRKNVFDDDEFDRLKVSAGQLHQGRKPIETKIEQGSEQHNKSKAAILAALAAFDSDDDERDDTYDVADVGGTVDDTVDTDNRTTEKSGQNVQEEILYHAYTGKQELFARDSKTRITPARQQLKRDTGMTDEQIEGWALMLKRDPASLAKLERRYAAARAFGGNQRNLGRTKWQASASSAESQDDTDGDHDGQKEDGNALDGRRMGQAQVRGSRNWGRGRGAGGGPSTAGSNTDAATQAARRRKEQGRGRGGANHNRREGRAKKIGRGMSRPDG